MLFSIKTSTRWYMSCYATNVTSRHASWCRVWLTGPAAAAVSWLVISRLLVFSLWTTCDLLFFKCYFPTSTHKYMSRNKHTQIHVTQQTHWYMPHNKHTVEFSWTNGAIRHSLYWKESPSPVVEFSWTVGSGYTMEKTETCCSLNALLQFWQIC